MANEQGQDEVLVDARMRDGATLVLHRQVLEKPSESARMRYLLNEKLVAGGATDTLFYLSYMSPGSKVASTVWLTYRAVYAMFPPSRFAAALIYDPDEHPVLIFVESGALETRFFLYRINLANRLADAPPPLDPELRERWPAASAPLSSLSYQLSPRESVGACFVSSIDAAWQDSSVTLRAHREPNECGSLFTAFDVRSGKWADVQKDTTGK